MCEITDLVRVAKRDNNTKRPYLYVNPSQGKHIPVSANIPLDLFRKMAQMLDESYVSEKLLIVGFAETATAIGAGVAFYSKNAVFCTQTTREFYDDKEYLHFSESHSHATDQGLIVDGYEDILSQIDRIVLVEDEVTTGNTICKLIDTIKDRFKLCDIQFGIISILNSMSEDRIDELLKQGIQCLFLKRIPFEYHIDEINDYEYITEDLSYDLISLEGQDDEITFLQNDLLNLRFLVSKDEYSSFGLNFVDDIVADLDLKDINKVLVLGTEEYMFIPMLLANVIKEQNPHIFVKNHATTRSPIMVSDDEYYPLNNRVVLKSCYEMKRKTFLYNLEHYDLCIVMSDATGSLDAYIDILSAVRRYGCHKFLVSGKGQV